MQPHSKGAGAAPGTGTSVTSGAGTSHDDNDNVPDAVPPNLSAKKSDSEDKRNKDEPSARTGRRGCRLPMRGQQEDADGPADLREQEMMAADRFLSKVYGDSVHRNDGQHLHDGIQAADDKAICWLYDQVVAYGYSLFRPPDGALGQDVVLTWVNELRGCRGISGAAAVRRQIERRLQS